MSKKVKASDKITESTLHEILLMMDARLKHIEDISADNRSIIVKLVKQSNQIVQFLKTLELEVSDLEYEIEEPPSFGVNLSKDKLLELKEFFNNQLPPKFNVKAKSLMDKFNLKEGKELGQKLKELELVWINNSFKITEKQIEKIVKS